MPFLKRPLTFTAPSIVSACSPQVCAKVKQDLREILREAEECLGPQDIDQVLKDHKRARVGRKPNRALNELLRAAYDVAAADGPVDIPKFSEDFYEKHHESQSARAVATRVRRLLPVWDKRRKLKVGILVREAGTK